ncbi:hypothetical protein MSWAN_1893 [Methanobacterium paludis]|uniref:Uncharacterized protein n=1 Tax=Methanobacterium paludis (strain DSM 25820 / JCM 18151 / SWAN1) TaxID=868131 RepID=F6D5U9_METPW|nr:hypothetical protein MSWAN_1893 [Methanobacterium paludis]
MVKGKLRSRSGISNLFNVFLTISTVNIHMEEK